MKTINNQLRTDPQTTVYLDLKDFPSNDKIEAFSTTYRIQQKKRGVVLPRQSDSTDSLDVLLSPGIQVDSQSNPVVKRIDKGEHKGLYGFAVKVFRKVGDRIQRGTLYVVAKTKEIANSFLNKLLLRLRLSPDTSLAVIVDDISKELKTRYKLSDDDLIKKFEDQAGNMYIVILFEDQTRDVYVVIHPTKNNRTI